MSRLWLSHMTKIGPWSCCTEALAPPGEIPATVLLPLEHSIVVFDRSEMVFDGTRY